MINMPTEDYRDLPDSTLCEVIAKASRYLSELSDVDDDREVIVAFTQEDDPQSAHATAGEFRQALEISGAAAMEVLTEQRGYSGLLIGMAAPLLNLGFNAEEFLECIAEPTFAEFVTRNGGTPDDIYIAMFIRGAQKGLSLMETYNAIIRSGL